MGSFEVLTQPTIGYSPDYDQYLARVQHRQQTETLPTTLPEGFPAQLKSDLVWDGSDIGSKYNWTYELSTNELEEIEAALSHFKGSSLRPTIRGCITDEDSTEHSTRPCQSRHLPTTKPPFRSPKDLRRTPQRPRLQSPARSASDQTYPRGEYHHLRRRVFTHRSHPRSTGSSARWEAG